MLDSNGLPPVPEAELVLSEVVMVAGIRGGGEFEVSLQIGDGRIKGAVYYGTADIRSRLDSFDNVSRTPDWGLFLIGKLADSWGVDEGRDGVWFEVAL
ncbi:MAG: hypothetical protein LC792_09470 [Actinobacteria bacterium]|nr:hypothetical protein [Actinomycetota bacterium]